MPCRCRTTGTGARPPAPGAPRASRGPQPAILEPAALGGVEHGLSAVDRAELAVDVVQVRTHRARRERELESDLLVDHALGETLEDLELAAGQRARLDRARAIL